MIMESKLSRYLTGGIIVSLAVLGTLVLAGCSAGGTTGGTETGSGAGKSGYTAVTVNQPRD